MDNVAGASQQGLDYVFSHFSPCSDLASLFARFSSMSLAGILLASTFYLIVYAAAMKSNPRLYPRIVLPSIGSGVLWATAQCSWFLVLASVPMAIAFPILSVLPCTSSHSSGGIRQTRFADCCYLAMISMAWGYFLFGENHGKRNVIIILSAGGLCVLSVVCTALSKSLPAA